MSDVVYTVELLGADGLDAAERAAWVGRFRAAMDARYGSAVDAAAAAFAEFDGLELEPDEEPWFDAMAEVQAELFADGPPAPGAHFDTGWEVVDVQAPKADWPATTAPF